MISVKARCCGRLEVSSHLASGLTCRMTLGNSNGQAVVLEDGLPTSEEPPGCERAAHISHMSMGHLLPPHISASIVHLRQTWNSGCPRPSSKVGNGEWARLPHLPAVLLQCPSLQRSSHLGPSLRSGEPGGWGGAGTPKHSQLLAGFTSCRQQMSSVFCLVIL